MKLKRVQWIFIAFLSCLPTVSVTAQDTAVVRGKVTDDSGSVIPRALVSLLSARQMVAGSTYTDDNGNFEMSGLTPGTYELQVSGVKGFIPRRIALRVPSSEARNLEIVLGFEALTEEVTVTADIGVVQSLDETTQQVNVIGDRKLEERGKAVLAQVANGEPGLQLQRTSATMGAIFVRGMTGAKVVNYVDGIRFSTATARGGVNTFFNLNDVSSLRSVEVLRGPNSAQFGSDSIGGAVQLITRTPLYSPGELEVHGRVSTGFNSADLSYRGSTLVTFGTRDLAVLLNLSSHRSNTIRSGGGLESHAAVTRFLGLPSTVFGERSTDTAFTQYGGLLKLSYRLTETDQLTVHYNRSQIDGGKRFDQTLGGDGNLRADLRNFMLDFVYLKYEKFKAGFFDSLSVSYSHNTQREERVNQGGNGNPLAGISHQWERTFVNGVQLQMTKLWGEANSLVIGGEYYYDYVRSPAFTVDPATGSAVPSRPRVPDRSSYHNGGIYVQNIWAVVPERFRLITALRYGGAAYSSRAENSPVVNGSRLWPDDSLTADSLTPRIGVVLTLTEGLNLSAQVSRGFRTPHITDLGTLGLTGNGYEASAPDLATSGATIGSTADRNAVSTNRPVTQLVPETSWSYEGGVHLHRSRIDIDINGFVNDIYDNIVVQTLILPAGAVGRQIGDQVVTSQNQNGAVFVPASTNPVLIRANLGDSRIWGIEQKFDLKLGRSWTFGQNFTYLHAADHETGLPPTIEGGTPAPQGWLRLRYDHPRHRFWFEPYLYAAWRQERLSTLDLEDRRTGATRSRASIQNFFRRGATVRGLVSAGADGRLGTADDILNPTGETLSQVQQRVLGGADSAPLFPYIPGFATYGVRGGIRIGDHHDLLFDLENLNDRNYRGIGWGMDAPGRSVGFWYRYQF